MVEVVEHDPRWVEDFARLRDAYAAALSERGVPVVAIEHVGSTAVQGLAAKPVIDVDVVVAREDIAAASAALGAIGLRPLGELGIPDRWAFAAPVELPRTHTYVVVEGSLALRNHVGVRDTLRSDQLLREQYAAVKRRLGAAAPDIDTYGQGKSAVIQRILAAAGLSDAERSSIADHQVSGHDDPARHRR